MPVGKYKLIVEQCCLCNYIWQAHSTDHAYLETVFLPDKHQCGMFYIKILSIQPSCLQVCYEFALKHPQRLLKENIIVTTEPLSVYLDTTRLFIGISNVYLMRRVDETFQCL